MSVDPNFYTSSTDHPVMATLKAAYTFTPFANIFPPDGAEEETLKEMYERGTFTKEEYEHELKILKLVKSHILHNNSLPTKLWHAATNTSPESALNYEARIRNPSMH